MVIALAIRVRVSVIVFAIRVRVRVIAFARRVRVIAFAIGWLCCGYCICDKG